ncbi:MAG: tetratricopeptide repeat protein, partial [Terriglobales bacterium]
MASPANPNQPSESQTSNRQKLILCILLATTTIAVYSPIIRAPFLNYDDALHVTENEHVRAGLTWSTVQWAFRSSETSDWHPITWLSHALDYELFGLSSAGPHAVNLLLHAINAVLLFLILEAATGFLWQSFGVAALFALHPINVESVAWISERKDVLSMFFFLLALGAYGWYVSRPGIGRYLMVTLAYAFALMTKAQVITFPFALLLLDYWPLRRIARIEQVEPTDESQASVPAKSFLSLVLEKIPWFALSAASAVITMNVEAEAMQAKYPLWVRLANAALAYAKYIGKAVWPLHLAALYPHPGLSINVVASVASASAIIGVSAFALVYRRHRPFFVGWFWFLGTLVPMIGLIQISIHSMADRYAYIPMLGIFVIISWGAGDLMDKWHLPKSALVAASSAALIGLAVMLSLQVSFWRDNVTLWTHTLAITQQNYTAEDMLASALLAEGKIEEGIPHLRQALVYYPNDAMATLNLATYDQMRGDYASALEGYSKVPHYTKNPGFIAQALINSGFAYMSLKEYQNATQDFITVVEAQPANAAAWRGLGLAEQRGGHLAQAIQPYQRTAQLEPSGANFLLLAEAYEQAGQADAARAAQSQAAAISTNLNDDNETVRRLLS